MNQLALALFNVSYISVKLGLNFSKILNSLMGEPKNSGNCLMQDRFNPTLLSNHYLPYSKAVLCPEAISIALNQSFSWDTLCFCQVFNLISTLFSTKTKLNGVLINTIQLRYEVFQPHSLVCGKYLWVKNSLFCILFKMVLSCFV